ncbi:acyl-CoA/acyl-ACP dehydrogenase [Chitiniphilus purpureus]|uniref:Acyl-CoA/acyl-ACP dehydrogenase n=1 Tax=Chitiniphilus purpureus TaxID=2981137 RepID=A0ABY6DN61_9NEIS|nr:acyl-CoA dehydrogenase family protein [Chitiniphilus sp. CD1]UXY15815.1 acyl-CoA/acyl-ACP dehydrogenase [Chitiniphilus sp. CD1]
MVKVATEITPDLVNILFNNSPLPDREGRFPHENISVLKDVRAFSLLVPQRYGGAACSVSDATSYAINLGGGCLSTALIWAMHSQQVATIAQMTGNRVSEVLADVTNQKLVASVTSEYEGGADLMTSNSPVFLKGEMIEVRRRAPVVSYASEADYFLMKMRETEDAAITKICALLISKTEINIEPLGAWNAMGMRGTQSIPVFFSGLIKPECLLEGDFKKTINSTMIPIGHLLWAASWYGAARFSLKRVLKIIPRRKLDSSEISLCTLSRIRMKLDAIAAMIEKGQRLLETKSGRFETHEMIFFNNLKIISSSYCFEVLRDLVEIAGIRDGFLQDSNTGLERVFRDISAASLMFPNDRIRVINGRLALFDNIF